MKKLLLIGICLLLASCSKESRLLDAAADGDLERVKSLVQAGANVNCWDDGRMPLAEAAKNGHTAVAAFLLNSGADVTYKHNHGRTPLHEAAEHGHAEIVSLLIKHKAEINKKSDHIETPLSLAKQKNHGEVIKLLVAAGAKELSELRKKPRQTTKEEDMKNFEKSRQRYLESRKKYNE